MQEEIIIERVKSWIENIVVKHNFCPFAARPFFDNKVNYKVVKAEDFGHFEAYFRRICEELSQSSDISTELLIIPQGLEDFENYLDFLDVCQGLIEFYDYEGVFQLASFHPQYQFMGVEPDDISNYTNRSPFPIIQLIKEESITEVLKFFKNPEDIPAQNVLRAKEIGLAGFEPYL